MVSEERTGRRGRHGEVGLRPDPHGGPAPGSRPGSDAGGEALADRYDAETWALIDGYRPGRPRRPAVSTRAAVTLWAAALRGVGEALEGPDEDDADVERAPSEPRRLEAVTLHFVPGDPRATLAIVRPWLL
jgi:hypothetical protein